MVMMCVGCQSLKSTSSLLTPKECDGEENPLQDKQLWNTKETRQHA